MRRLFRAGQSCGKLNAMGKTLKIKGLEKFSGNSAPDTRSGQASRLRGGRSGCLKVVRVRGTVIPVRWLAVSADTTAL